MVARLGSVQQLDFRDYVRPGDGVLWGQVGAEPCTLTERLLAQRGEVGGFRCFLGLSAAATVRPEHGDRVSFSSYTGSGRNAALHAAGVLDVLPMHYSSFPDLIDRGVIGADVVLLQLAPPDENGRYGLGLALEYLGAALDRARVIIAEVNDQVPWVFGDRTLTDADLTAVVHTSRPPATLVRSGVGPVQERVAERVGGLIEDGSTLQLGLGALPEAVLAWLTDRKDLGVHSGQIGDAVADLMEAGVITGARKSVDRGQTVTGGLLGGERLYRYAHLNDRIDLRDTRYTHDPEVLAAQHKFVALNSAVEVDLSGQVNAEMAGGRYVGAVGGAVDFLRGAHRSRGGLPIIALPATAGPHSRIVARLSGPVSTPRSDAGIIVTEHGAADLRGLSLAARYERMIAVAAPEHRAALDEAAAGMSPQRTPNREPLTEKERMG